MTVEDPQGPFVLCYDGSEASQRAIRIAPVLLGAGRPARVVYAYKPAVSFGLVPNLTFGDTIYMNPRNSNSVTCNGCS